MATVPCLVGRIIYRLDLSGGGGKSAAAAAGRKRPRPGNDDDGRDGGGDEHNKSSSTDGERGRWVNTMGYYFAPSDEQGGINGGGSLGGGGGPYPLVVPFGLLGMACRAARTGAAVEITGFAWVRHGPDGGGRCCGGHAGRVLVLEVHAGGMRVTDGEVPARRDSGRDDGGSERRDGGRGGGEEEEEEPPITLSQFATLEKRLRSEKRKNKKDRKAAAAAGGAGGGGGGGERYSVRATVDSASPVIAAVPSDPFALVELYEEAVPTDSAQEQFPSCPPLGAVAVLRGRSALSVLPALQPGITVMLKNVRRQRWHVPKSLRAAENGAGLLGRLRQRAPTHVFVVDDGRSVRWSSTAEGGGGGIRREGGEDAVGVDAGEPALPTTAAPLEAIQGLVVSVRRTNAGPDGTQTVHNVTIDPGDDGSTRRFKLYLTYYPMSPDLIWGLRVGASARAVNVHRIRIDRGDDDGSSVAYGACLRSSVNLLKCASDGFGRSRTLSDGKNRSSTCSQADQGENFVPALRCPPYSFVNVRRTYGEYEWRSTLRTDWYDKSGLCSIPTSPGFEDVANALLEHCRESTGEVESGPLAAHEKTDGGRRKKKRTKKRRDPYAEFFDHACDVDGFDIGSGRCHQAGCGVTTNDREAQGWPTVLPLRLVRDRCMLYMKNRIASYLTGDVSEDFGGKNGRRARREVESGWTSSVCLTDDLLGQVLFDRDRSALQSSSIGDRVGLYACGFADSSLASIRDGHCQLPLIRSCSASRVDEIADKYNHLRNMRAFQGGEFVAARVHAVMVSCLCLGTKPKESVPKTENLTSQSRPSGETNESNSVGRPVCSITKCLPILPTSGKARLAVYPFRSKDTGPCAVFIAKGLIFIVSVHMHSYSSDPLRIQPISPRTDHRGTTKGCTIPVRKLVSVQDHLAGKPMTGEGQFVLGRLVRSRYSFRKLRNDTHKGCVLTLSHVPLVPSEGDFYPSTNQSLELKLSIPLLSGKVTSQMRQAMQFLVEERVASGTNDVILSYLVTDDQINLASAWWRLAEDAEVCPLLFGGWDEYYGSTETSTYWTVCLEFPVTARETSERGYQRNSCSLDDIDVYLVRSIAPDATASVDNNLAENRPSDQNDNAVTRANLPLFDYVGGEKFLPGMLDRRTRRNRSFVRELLSFPPEVSSGISTSNLAQLHWDICQDLKEKTRTSVSPSLVRRVKGAQLLGITFCRARAECTRCFKFLTRRREGQRKDPTSGVVSSVKLSNFSDDKKEDTFWHLPLPFGCNGDRFMNSGHSRSGAVEEKSRDGASTRKKNALSGEYRSLTKLCCPSDCPINLAAIKWECSGIIDDGTAQAKVHAEREAALALLGNRLDAKSVEDGAWATEAGITFQKSVPPRSFIKNAVREAQMMSYQLARDRARNKRRKVTHFDVLKLLTQEARAEYVLQRHCRQSKPPIMDFICRCKPIADGAYHLNRTEVNVTTARKEAEAVTSDIVTYSLPPLKLILVDCCSASQSWCDRDNGWDLVRAMV